MREKILAVIEKNSRIDLKDLAILLGESEVAVANEIAQMEKEHIICGYHTLINWDNTSDEKVVALIEVKVTPQRGMGFDKIAERIYQYSEVNAVYLMSGAFDFTVFIEGKTMRQVAQFVSERRDPLPACHDGLSGPAPPELSGGLPPASGGGGGGRAGFLPLTADSGG